ncbi:MAG: hypothetical protein GY801_13415 [bacterium]|nr:hypothetical protein [bacterium]
MCFSKNETIHDNVIGMYMSHYYDTNASYAQVV